jgi:hypothetical protein
MLFLTNSSNPNTDAHMQEASNSYAYAIPKHLFDLRPPNHFYRPPPYWPPGTDPRIHEPIRAPKPNEPGFHEYCSITGFDPYTPWDDTYGYTYSLSFNANTSLARALERVLSPEEFNAWEKYAANLMRPRILPPAGGIWVENKIAPDAVVRTEALRQRGSIDPQTGRILRGEFDHLVPHVHEQAPRAGGESCTFAATPEPAPSPSPAPAANARKRCYRELVESDED